MIVKLNRESKQIKSGFCSRSVVLGMAAHGHSPETADRNLERGVKLFLAPFERQGTLVTELHALGLQFDPDGDGLRVVLEPD